VAIVVVVQGLVFADGGLTALGYNILNMAIVPAYGGWAAFSLFRRVLPRSTGGVVAAAGLASWSSVVMAAMAFSIEWLFGATAPVPFTRVFAAMVGVHLLIGIGEAVIGSLAVGAVLASRPDLVTGAADLEPSELANRKPVTARAFLIGGVLATLLFATIVSQFAADDPDGLERVSEDVGFAASGEDHALSSSIFADYATEGVENPGLSLAIAGTAGAVIVLAVGWGIFGAIRGGGHKRPRPAAPA
jgi:cobalt/nickel transport system permease protein